MILPQMLKAKKNFHKARLLSKRIYEIHEEENLAERKKLILASDDGVSCINCPNWEACGKSESAWWTHPNDPLLNIINTWINRYLVDPNTLEPVVLSPIQEKIVITALTNSFSLIMAYRGAGKTYALAIAALIWAFFNPDSEQVYIAAPSSHHSDLIYKNVTDFIAHSKNQRLLKGDIAIGYRGIQNIKTGIKCEISFTDGSIIRARGVHENNKGMTMIGSHPTFLLVDESSKISDSVYQNALKATVRGNVGALKRDKPVIEIGTPEGRNHFFDVINNRPKFKHYKVLNFDYKDGLEVGSITQKEIDEAIKECNGDDTPEFLSNYCNVFAPNSINFMPPPLIDKMFSLENIPATPQEGVEYVAGVDIGRQDDSTVMWIAEHKMFENTIDYLNCVYVREIEASENRTYPDQRLEIFNLCNTWNVSRLVLDSTGVGIEFHEEMVKDFATWGARTAIETFTFSRATKYPNYLFLKSVAYEGRLKFPKLESIREVNQHKPILRAIDQFQDLVQQRTNASNDSSMYKIAASSKRKHDDHPSSVLCLIQTLDKTAGTIGVVNVEVENNHKRSSVFSALKPVDIDFKNRRINRDKYRKNHRLYL